MVDTEVPLASNSPDTSMLLKAAFAPTLPPKRVSPVVLMAKVYAPFKVSTKRMLPAAVLLRAVLAPKLAASPKVCAPEVLTEPPLIATLPPALVVKLTNAALLPTAPPKMVSPVVLMAKVYAPFKVSAKRMLPPPVLLRAVLAPKVAASR